MQFVSLPEKGFVRLPTILQMIPVSKSTWWAKVKTGEYPQPVKLTDKITAWKAEDIHTLIDMLGNEAGASAELPMNLPMKN